MGLFKKTLSTLILSATLAISPSAKENQEPVTDFINQSPHFKEYTYLKRLEEITKKDLVFNTGWIEFRQSFKEPVSKLRNELQFESINSSLSNELVLNYTTNTNLFFRINMETKLPQELSLINELKHIIYFGDPQETKISTRLKYWLFEFGVGFGYQKKPAIEAIINVDLSRYFY